MSPEYTLTFHVSQLKKAVPPNHSVCSELPILSDSLQVPLEILDRRLHLHREKTQPQVLVRWSRTPLELSTWEDEDALRQQFPRAPAWGQAIFQGLRNVTRAPVPPTKKDEDVGAIQEGEGGLTKRARRPNPRVTGPAWL